LGAEPRYGVTSLIVLGHPPARGRPAARARDALPILQSVSFRQECCAVVPAEPTAPRQR